jgi:N-acetyl sugar amidotransferase
MSEKTIKYCAKCLLDTSMGGVHIEENGNCNFCNNYNDYYKSIFSINDKQNELLQKINKIKKDGTNKPYDCILGLSGGVDSSYLAYMAKKVWGLRPLGVHLDNGWNDELAVSNIEKICKQLDIDLITYVINWNEFKDLQVSFLKASVENAEAPTDHAIYSTLFQLASKHHIKYILDGANHQTEYNRVGFLPGGYTYSDWSQIKGIHNRFGNIQLKTFPKLQFWKRAYYSIIKGIQKVNLLGLCDYNKVAATNLLIEQLKWVPYKGKHHESMFTKWHQCVYLPEKFKFDKRKIHLSDLILSGQLNKQNALTEIEVPAIESVEKKELENYVMKKLGLTHIEYEQIKNAQPISYKAYPNNAKFINYYLNARKTLKFK